MGQKQGFLRRDLVKGLAGLGAISQANAQPGFSVGLKYGTDPYSTTIAAIMASGEFPPVFGRTVVIKPNLVTAALANTGTVTDPEVVRAIADVALARGAASVVICEASGLSEGAAPFTECGYDYLRTYDPRVALLDLATEPLVAVRNTSAFIYRRLFLPRIATLSNTVWISAAKLKVHQMAAMTGAVKNLFGLFMPSLYRYQTGDFIARTDPHEFGLDQSTIDMFTARPLSYAVTDGIVGMEEKGPISGTPIQSNTILAGSNALAVDRVAAQQMAVPFERISHLTLAQRIGLGPQSLSQISIRGDALVQTPFKQATLILPPTGAPSSDRSIVTAPQGATVTYSVPAGNVFFTRLEVISNDFDNPGVQVRRLLADWRQQGPGSYQVFWDGLDDQQNALPPGQYFLRLLTRWKTAPVTARILFGSASRSVLVG